MSPVELVAAAGIILSLGKVGRRLDELLVHTRALRHYAELREVREQQLFGQADAREQLRRP